MHDRASEVVLAAARPAGGVYVPNTGASMSGDPFVLFESPEGGAIGEALARRLIDSQFPQGFRAGRLGAAPAARACSPASAADPEPGGHRRAGRRVPVPLVGVSLVRWQAGFDRPHPRRQAWTSSRRSCAIRRSSATSRCMPPMPNCSSAPVIARALRAPTRRRSGLVVMPSTEPSSSGACRTFEKPVQIASRAASYW